jgi:BirA family transcriptional regulator, biotin operon repressor / biotin---[acetyl-CoA-carboxylase] ligase
VDSTNNYAMEQISQGEVTEGTVYLALEQTAGKGQRGKNWVAGSGDSILMSMVLQPLLLAPSQQFVLSAGIALGTLDFLKKYLPADTSIKWSNDLYWRDRKAGGILIENVIRGNSWSYAVAGIGININQEIFSANLPNPVSLKQITGQHWEVEELAKDLCECLLLRYGQIKNGKQVQILSDYRHFLYRWKMPAKYKSKGYLFTGKIINVEEDGVLVIETEGKVNKFSFGEIEFIFD